MMSPQPVLRLYRIAGFLSGVPLGCSLRGDSGRTAKRLQATLSREVIPIPAPRRATSGRTSPRGGAPLNRGVDDA